MTDVQAQYMQIRKVITGGRGSNKGIDGQMLVGNDTTAIDMPGTVRNGRDAITLPARYDFLANQPSIDLQWANNDTVGDSNIFMESLASVQDSARNSQVGSPPHSVDLARGLRMSTPLHGRYTVDPSDLNQAQRMSSPLDPFDHATLLAEVQGAEDVDFGLEVGPIGDTTTDPLALDDLG
jgi:hypothetical protein